MSALHTLALHELCELLNRRACSSVEIVNDVLAAIDARDHKIGAYLHVDREEVLAAAASADQVRKRGTQTPLLGLPIAIKDLLNAKGQPCTCASKILKGYVSPYDATCLSRLKAAGAILLGRVNMDEFAMGGSTENSAYQLTRNPWDLDYVPGGSSGGSAAAVAGYMALASIGSDTGGSIRQPASFCGCVGLKPTYGRISRYGLTAFASSLDQVGPLTRDVEDAALLLQHMAGHDRMDSTSLAVDVPDYRAALTSELTGLKLGVPHEYFSNGLEPQVERAVRSAIEKCGELGAEIVEVSLPHTEYAIAVYYIICTAEASSNLSRFDGVRYGARVEDDDPIAMYGSTREHGFGNEVKRRVVLGTYVLSSGYYDAYYLRAQKVRTLIRKDFENSFEHCDAIVAPVSPTSAYRIGEKTEDPLQMYLGDILTVPANLAGIPGLSVPCGFTTDGLPIGLQVLGPALREDVVLRIAHAFEQNSKFRLRKPPNVGKGCE